MGTSHSAVNALVYAGTTSWLRWRIDRPLAQLYAARYAQEAELRFARVRLNEHIDSVSLHGGEEGEKGTPDTELKGVLRIMWRIVAATTPLKWKATFSEPGVRYTYRLHHARRAAR